MSGRRAKALRAQAMEMTRGYPERMWSVYRELKRTWKQKTQR